MTVAAIGLGVAAVGTAYGAYSASETASDNRALSEQAREDESKRRKKAQKEFAKAVEAYNKIREDRPGLTFKEFSKEQIQALNDPALLASFQQATQSSFDIAQLIADQATKSNLSNFQSAVEQLSGGKYEELLAARNEAILNDNPQEALRRSIELQSPFLLPGGSVNVGPDGIPISGQRADALTFQLAYETQDAMQQRRLTNASNAIRDDRDAATRQQEKALSFLESSDFTGFASDLARDSLAQRIAYQNADETRQFGLATSFAQAAANDSTRQPNFQSNAADLALIQSSLDLAGTALASRSKS